MPSSRSRRRFLATVAGGVGVAVVGSATVRSRSGADQAGTTGTPATRSPSPVWSDQFDGRMFVGPFDAAVAHAGGVVVLIGYYDESPNAKAVAFERDGTRAWSVEFFASDRTVPAAIVRTDDGYLVTGHVGDSAVPWVASLAADGRRHWERRIESVGSFWPASGAARSEGMVLGGSLDREETPVAAMLAVDGDGDREWLETYDGAFSDVADVVPTADGFALVADITNDATVLGTEGDGAETWRYSFASSDFDRLNAISPRPDGAVVAGAVESPNATGALLSRIDRRGRPVWRRVYPSSLDDETAGPGGESPAVDLDPLGGGFAIAREYELLATDGLGRPEWVIDAREIRQRQADTVSTATVADDRVYVTGLADEHGWVAAIQLG